MINAYQKFWNLCQLAAVTYMSKLHPLNMLNSATDIDFPSV